MANDAKKISDLAIANTLSANDRVVILANPSTSANVKTITANNFANSIISKYISNTAPASNTATGFAGQIAYDNTYLYVCTGNNVWGRIDLTLSW